MPRLALHLLGPPQIELDGKSIHLERRKSIALLAYLAVEGGQHSRDFLSSLLWPDTNQSNAFKNLRQVLWEIQQSLGEGWLVSDREKIGLTDADTWVDVREFASRLSEGISQDDITLRVPLLADAVRLYRSHFLAGFLLKDAHPFNEWAFAESEDLQQKLSTALSRLSEDHCELGQARLAIPHARRLVSLDPLDEAANRLLMRIYLQAGQLTAALKQYQTFEQVLRKELNIDPQPETRALYKEIRKGEMRPVLVESQPAALPTPHNLPFQVSTFIGREKQQEEVIALLAKNRLVTLAGTGGIGKTRLSVQLGHKVLNHYPDGVWFIGLDALSDPELVPQTVTAIFELRENPSRPILERLIDYLRPKTSLLIFDNCEHLLEACARLATTLLEHCPALQILATSRETLNIAGEAMYRMSSLSVPEGNPPVDELMQYESIRLFCERAALVLPSFILTSENAGPVLEICRKVDGIPLAIELAAARVNILQVEEILDQLNQSFALLSSDNRPLQPRHQTLRASIEWSWGLLSEGEQKFLRQLSAFAGGWTLEAAQAVCDVDVLGATSTLVKKSIIVVNQEPGRGTRYRFHEMVREHIHEKAHAMGDDREIHTRHLLYFLALAKKAEHELRGPSRVDWIERLNEEQNNIRVALHWAEQTDVEAGLTLAGTLRRFWESSNLQEGLERLRAFLNKPESNEYPRVRATALITYGWLLTWLQNFDLADSVTQESLRLFRQIGDLQGEVDALILGENVAQFKYDMKIALALGERALALSRSLGDPWQEANALYYLGWNTRNYELMFSYWEKAIGLYRQVGDQVSLANSLGLLGQFRVLNGDFVLGESHLDEALQLWESNPRANIWDTPRIAKSLLLSMKGNHEEARGMLQEVLTAAQETGNTMAQLWAEVRLGHAALRAGNVEEARQHLTRTATAFSKDGYTVGVIFAVEGIAGLYLTIGKPELAARLIGWADEIRANVDDTRPHIEQAEVDKMIAACLLKLGEAAFSDLYDECRKMTLDQAVSFALGQGEF